MIKRSLEPRETRARETREHGFLLESGWYLALEVDQMGCDLVVNLDDPTGERRVVDHALHDHAAEPIYLVSKVAGPYVVRVESRHNETCVYQLRVIDHRVAQAADHHRHCAAEMHASAEALWRESRWREAAARYSSAEVGWKTAGESVMAGLALHMRGVSLQAASEHAEAIRAFERAASLFAASGRHVERYWAQHRQGVILHEVGDWHGAAEAFEVSLSVAQDLGDIDKVAAQIANLAGASEALGETQRALDLYEASFDYASEPSRSFYARRVKLANLYARSGRWQTAIQLLEGVPEALQALGDRPWMAQALATRALALRRGGRSEAAMEALDAAWQVTPDDVDELLRLELEMARTRMKLGEPAEARMVFWSVRDRARSHHKGDFESAALLGLAAIDRVAGDFASSQRHLERVARLASEMDRPGVQLGLHYELAELARSQGDLDTALQEAKRLVEGVEAQRLKSAAGSLRGDFFAERQGYLGLLVELLVTLDEQRPGQGYAARAFAASQRRRARLLLDLIAAGSGDPDDPMATLGLPMAVVSLVELRELIDPETVVLAFDLGRERSFLWQIRGDGVDRFELPSGAVIDALAREVHGLLVHSRQLRARRALRRKLIELSDILLGPMAHDLTVKRVVVIADAALHYVPFAALPLPEGHPALEVDTERQPLVTAHEIVYLPSLVLLGQLRARERHRPPPMGTVAVIADPVFGPEDPRLETDGRPPPPTHKIPPSRPTFPRLSWAGREAKAILDLVPERESFTAQGLDATAEVLYSPEVARFRFLHVATHGIVDSLRPEHSGLMFSRLDAWGKPRSDAFVPLAAVRRLHLPVEMAVLSACGTGLGEELRGEGLVGLSHAFLQAGAQRVVVSLWAVDDRATAELMSAFYRFLLVTGLPPAAALRQAQLETRERYPEPALWAAFQLYGDWRPSFL